jgi:hypothetical protein
MADAFSFMSEGQAIFAARVDKPAQPFVELRRGMPPQASTSGKRSEQGATCLFLQFAGSAAGMHFGAVRPLLSLVW